MTIRFNGPVNIRGPIAGRGVYVGGRQVEPDPCAHCGRPMEQDQYIEDGHAYCSERCKEAGPK